MTTKEVDEDETHVITIQENNKVQVTVVKKESTIISKKAEIYSNQQFEMLMDKKRTLDKMKEDDTNANSARVQDVEIDDKNEEKNENYLLEEDLALENKNSIIKIMQNEGLMARDMSDELMYYILK
jgi:hypothetical protein